MRTSLRHDLKTAMRERDRVAISALRSVIAGIENAEAVEPTGRPVASTSDPHIAGSAGGAGAAEADRRVVSEADEVAFVREAVAERRSAAAEYESLGHDDQATRLHAEADVLARYLPT